MTGIDIDAIRKLADAATRGPWEAEGEIVQVVGETRYVCDVFGLADKWPTAEFIAAARTVVPALCDELEQTRAAYARAEKRAASLANEVGALKAELERMRAVVEAAKAWRQMRRDWRTTPSQVSEALVAAVDALEPAEVAR